MDHACFEMVRSLKKVRTGRRFERLSYPPESFYPDYTGVSILIFIAGEDPTYSLYSLMPGPRIIPLVPVGSISPYGSSSNLLPL